MSTLTPFTASLPDYSVHDAAFVLCGLEPQERGTYQVQQMQRRLAEAIARNEIAFRACDAERIPGPTGITVEFEPDRRRMFQRAWRATGNIHTQDAEPLCPRSMIVTRHAVFEWASSQGILNSGLGDQSVRTGQSEIEGLHAVRNGEAATPMVRSTDSAHDTHCAIDTKLIAVLIHGLKESLLREHSATKIAELIEAEASQQFGDEAVKVKAISKRIQQAEALLPRIQECGKAAFVPRRLRQKNNDLRIIWALTALVFQGGDGNRSEVVHSVALRWLGSEAPTIIEIEDRIQAASEFKQKAIG